MAHDELLSVDLVAAPSDGSPEAIRLSFNNSIIEAGIEIMVTGPNDLDATGGAPEISGPNVTQKLAANLPVGDYSSAWRVVSSDGHPIEGAFSFSITGEETAENLPAVTLGNSAAEHSEDEANVDAIAAPAADSAGLPTGAIIGISIGAVVVVAGAVAAILIGQRRRKQAFAAAAGQANNINDINTSTENEDQR